MEFLCENIVMNRAQTADFGECRASVFVQLKPHLFIYFNSDVRRFLYAL